MFRLVSYKPAFTVVLKLPSCCFFVFLQTKVRFDFTAQRKCIKTKTGRGTALPSHHPQVTVEQLEYLWKPGKKPADREVKEGK